MPADADPLAHLPGRDAGAERVDDADDLVARHARELRGPGIAPVLVKTSLWQTPHASTLTRTWPGPGSGRSRSTSSRGPPALATCTTRILGMFVVSSEGNRTILYRGGPLRLDIFVLPNRNCHGPSGLAGSAVGNLCSEPAKSACCGRGRDGGGADGLAVVHSRRPVRRAHGGRISVPVGGLDGTGDDRRFPPRLCGDRHADRVLQSARHPDGLPQRPVRPPLRRPGDLRRRIDPDGRRRRGDGAQ